MVTVRCLQNGELDYFEMEQRFYVSTVKYSKIVNIKES